MFRFFILGSTASHQGLSIDSRIDHMLKHQSGFDLSFFGFNAVEVGDGDRRVSLDVNDIPGLGPIINRPSRAVVDGD